LKNKSSALFIIFHKTLNTFLRLFVSNFISTKSDKKNSSQNDTLKLVIEILVNWNIPAGISTHENNIFMKISYFYKKDICIARRSLRKPFLLNVSIYWLNWFARLEYLKPISVQLPERISPFGTIIEGPLKTLEHHSTMVPGSLRGAKKPPLCQENTTHRYVYLMIRLSFNWFCLDGFKTIGIFFHTILLGFI